MSHRTKAVILLSGGLDSATVLAMAKVRNFDCYTIGFNYGQKHNSELAAANVIAEALSDHPHKMIRIDLGTIGGSALTTDTINVPVGGVSESGIPVTYVPARNTIFLSIALGYGEVIGATHLFIGANAVDYSGYPDCRPEFIQQFQILANVATASVDNDSRWVIEAPLMLMSKSDIVTSGTALGVDYGMTVSCYKANDDGAACGVCDACRLRRKGFLDAGLSDPTRYQLGISPQV